MVDQFVPSFVWRNPTRIVYGVDSLDGLPDEVRAVAGDGARVFAVTGRSFLRSSGLLARIEGLMADFEATLHDKADPFPTPADADEAAAACRDAGADLVVGIGGGSALDLAKATAILATHDGAAKDYATGARQFERRGLPFVAVPTTSGSSSEVTSGSALWDWDTSSQFGLGDTLMFPTVAIVDPRLAMSMSQTLAANTGMDAFTSAFESYWNVDAEPVSDALALETIRLYSANLVRSAIQGDYGIARRVRSGGYDFRRRVQQQRAQRLPRGGQSVDAALARRAWAVGMRHAVIVPALVRSGDSPQDAGAAGGAGSGRLGRGLREDRANHRVVRSRDSAIRAGHWGGGRWDDC